jgi:hypothetical protein
MHTRTRLSPWLGAPLALASLLGCVSTSRASYVYDIQPPTSDTGALLLTPRVDTSIYKRKAAWSDPQTLLVFELPIENKGERVIRTEGLKIVFDYRGEPYTALTKAQILEWLRDTPAPDAAVQQAAAGKRLFNEGLEILPSYKTVSYVCFPITPDLAVDGKIRLFDVPSEVDKSGHVTKRKNVEFSVARQTISG